MRTTIDNISLSVFSKVMEPGLDLNWRLLNLLSDMLPNEQWRPASCSSNKCIGNSSNCSTSDISGISSSNSYINIIILLSVT